MRSAAEHMFAHQVSRPEDAIDLAVAALLIGEIEGGSVDIGHYLQLLDDFAGLADVYRSREEGPFGAVRALNRALFGDLGFRGNQDDYHDPRNSFLDRVIDSRRGIPISLSIIYLEVAARIGAEVHGINFPGHFLVGHEEDGERLIIDPFRMGLILGDEALRDLLRTARQGDPDEPRIAEEHLAPAGKRQILVRMLGNLAGIYSRRGDVYRSIEVLERILIVEPGNSRIERELTRLRNRASDMN
jgi:regulator of sirC expression with transglutaminase-like and TPR domain